MWVQSALQLLALRAKAQRMLSQWIAAKIWLGKLVTNLKTTRAKSALRPDLGTCTIRNDFMGRGALHS